MTPIFPSVFGGGKSRCGALSGAFRLRGNDGMSFASLQCMLMNVESICALMSIIACMHLFLRPPWAPPGGHLCVGGENVGTKLFSWFFGRDNSPPFIIFLCHIQTHPAVAHPGNPPETSLPERRVRRSALIITPFGYRALSEMVVFAFVSPRDAP